LQHVIPGGYKFMKRYYNVVVFEKWLCNPFGISIYKGGDNDETVEVMCIAHISKNFGVCNLLD